MSNFKHAVRSLSRTPGFTTIAILTLALGIGAGIAIFTIVHAVLWRRLPFPQPDQLVRVYDDWKGTGTMDVGMSVPELEDLRRQPEIFTGISAIWPVSTALTGGERAERVEMLGTSPCYFEMLGARAAVGRVYGQADWVPGFLDGVVISDGLWKRQFGGDPRVIGRRIRVDEDGYTIIGVMPPEFRHPGRTLNGDVEIWAAAGFVGPPGPVPPVRGLRLFPGAMGRLKPGLSLGQAQQRLDALVSELQSRYPKDYPAEVRWALRIEGVQESLTGRTRPALLILFAAVGFVLLIVCVNLAGLLMAKSLGRRREIAIRAALGATRGQLMKLLLAESVVVSLAGGVAAVGMLLAARGALLALLPPDLPRLSEVRFEWLGFGLAFVVACGSGVLIGLAPAMQASKADPNTDLKEGDRAGGSGGVRHTKMRSALVMAEIAISTVLLIACGLLVRSFASMLRQDPGFEARNVAVGQIWIPVPNNPDANRYLRPAQRATLAQELLRRVQGLPGVEKAAVVTDGAVPLLASENPALPFSLPGSGDAAGKPSAAKFAAVSADYFGVVQVPLKRGREFSEHDTNTSKPVVIVNEAFVRKYSPGVDLLGGRLRGPGGREMEIVGIVGDIRDLSLDLPASPRVYAPILQASGTSLAVLLRTAASAASYREPLAQMVHEVDPELPVFGVGAMEDLIRGSLARRRFTLQLMMGFAGVALVLAGMGIYGVMAYLVSRRTREFGIRLALGARPGQIASTSFRPALVMLGVGAAAGLGVSLVVTPLMGSVLYGVAALDPLTFAVVPPVVGVVTMAACWVPARRASRLSPTTALHSL